LHRWRLGAAQVREDVDVTPLRQRLIDLLDGHGARAEHRDDLVKLR
jgi:hypothetical protein